MKDFGTLSFFKGYLHRSNVTKITKKAVDANVELFLTVFKGHILACACNLLGCGSVDDSLQLPSGILLASRKHKWEYIRQVSSKIVDVCTIVDISNDVKDTEDKVYNYARVLCHYGAMLLEFWDAWAEGDGERVFNCWRVFLPHFKAGGRSKYALEALRFQLQVKSLLSPRLAHQAKWDCFINTCGGLGNNIPNDLFNEHINKLLKGIVTTMGPNLTDKYLQRAARTVSTVFQIRKQFDKQSGVPVVTTAHSFVSDIGDVSIVVAIVLKEDILNIHPGRHHIKYRSMKLNPVPNLDKEKVVEWIGKKVKQFEKHNFFSESL